MKKNLLVYFLFLILGIFYFHKVIFSDRVFIIGDLSISDLMNLNYPLRYFLAECIKKFSFPLWCPDIFLGYPLFAESQMAGAYPINLFFFYLLDYIRAFNYSLVLHYVLASLFMYLYCRILRLSMFASIFAGIAFAYSAFMILHLKHTNMQNTAIWLPLLFYLYELFHRKRNLIFAVVCGIVFGIQILAGHSQMAYYSLLALTIYFLYKWTSNLYTTKKFVLLYPIGFGLIILIGVLLASIQILPTCELLNLCGRGQQGVGLSTALDWGFRPKDLLMFLSPFYQGNFVYNTYSEQRALFWENCPYVGLLPLVFMIISFSLIHKNSYIKFYLFLLFLSMSLVLANYARPIFDLFYNYLPGFKFFRFPNRFLLITTFCISILSAYGFNLVLKKFKNNKKKIIVSISILGVCFFDLYIFGKDQNPVISAKEWFRTPKVISFLNTELRNNGLFRIYSLEDHASYRFSYLKANGFIKLTPYIEHREILQPNFNIFYNIQSSEGYTAILPKRLMYLNYHRYGPSQDAYLFCDGRAILKREKELSKILGLFNVRYVLSMWQFQSKFFKPVHKIKTDYLPGITVYQNKSYLPRAYLVDDIILTKTAQESLQLIESDWFNPKNTVIIETTSPENMIKNMIINTSLRNSSSSLGKCKITKYENCMVEIQADCNKDCMLVLADYFYPGWSCYVDNKKTKIYKANYILRAINLERGKHKIKFVYEPLSFRIGLLISSLTSLFCFTFLIKRVRFINKK